MTIAHAPAPCGVCGRASRGFAVSLPESFHTFCSFYCSEVWMIAQRRNEPLGQDEAKAAKAGGAAAGAYLEEIGKFDLRDMNADEWGEFCGKLFRGACDDLRKQAEKHVPF